MKVPRSRCGNCFSQISGTNKICPVCGFGKTVGDQAPALPRGTALAGRYVVGGCIGRGGFGITYLAYDTTDKKTVAVKEYFPSMLAVRGRGKHVVPNCEKNAEQFNIGAEKFFDEAELVRQFNGNPNIVSIYECFYENNTAYFIMEYLDGITLENYVKKYGVPDTEQAAYLADKLTMALVVLHSGGVLHRDISPDNLMLCKDKSVKLIDFGAARQCAFDGSHGYTVMMKTGFSPMEQYSQDGSADVRSDIYSAGMLLYYALTGNIPESPYKRLADDSAFRANAAAGGLWQVIEKAAAVMPAERYNTAEEFRSGLSGLGINAAAISVPTDYDPFEGGRFSESILRKNPKKRVGAKIIAAIAAAVCVIAAVPFFVNGLRGRASVLENGKSERLLGSEYPGHFNIGGRIPASELKRFGGDVEITLKVKPWEKKDPANICGVIPVNSDGRIMIGHMYAADELRADENGWITVENDAETVTLVLSEEGVESLGNGELGFEVYNLVITSAELKRADKKLGIGIDDWYELRNAAYFVSEGENGKTVDVPLSENRVHSWPSFESQAIPKSAFYEFGGDVTVTLTIEALDCPESEQPIVNVSNSGYCFDLMRGRILVPAAKDSLGTPLVKLDRYNGMMISKGCPKLTFVIPEDAKEKMSSGVFFQCMGVKVTRARLTDYNGEFGEFL